VTNVENIATQGLAHRKADQRIPMPTETVGELLRQHAQRIGDRPAVIDIVDEATDTLETYSYRQLLELSENLARWLLASSKPGDRIAVWSRNEFEAVLVQFGCALSGTILVHFNTAWTDAEVEHALRLVEPTLAFVGKDHAGRNLETRLKQLASCTVLPLAEIRRIAYEKSDLPLPVVKQSDPCIIQFTSGTTGKAKAAVLSHRAALLGGCVRPRCEGATEKDVWLNAVPFHHIGGTCAVTLGAVGVGGSFVVLQRFDRDQLIRLMPKVNATRMGGVPTMWHDMLAAPNLPTNVKLKSVSLGGASVPPELAKGIFDRLGARCGIGYGQSEFSIISATMPEDPIDVVCNSVGRPMPFVEVKIINPDTGEILRYNEAGEICLRGPMCMDGYWSNPNATAETIDGEGFLHTGDMGTLGADGICKVKGRVREMIIRGGENIYPAEIENALMTHPAVAMVAVLGVAHPRLGQEVGAVVKLKKGVDVSIPELELHVGKFVAKFKIPKAWHFIDAMPVTASGKIRKVELEPLFAQA